LPTILWFEVKKMPAKWARVSPAVLAAATPVPGGIMIMATIAKKHLTLFVRSRRAPGAGHPDVKSAFTTAAHKTLGLAMRSERTAIIKREVKGKGPGKIRRKSRARPGSPLYGHVYETTVKG
jgi:hypothetical protein